MVARIKIGFADCSPIEDRSASSGVPFSVAAALDKWCGDVVELGPFSPSENYPLRHRICNQLTWSLLRKTLYWPYSRSCITDWARRVQTALESTACDVVFATERSMWTVALLKTSKPIVVFTDSTTRAVRRMGGYFHDNLPVLQLARAARLENSLFRRARAVLVSSTWALSSVINDYGISPDRVTLTPFGANILSHEVPPGGRSRRSGPSDTCRLLWIGGNWSRKGGDQALQIRDELEKLGLNAHLTLVGYNVRSPGGNSQVRIVGPLQKGNPDEARLFWEILRSSDFHILPSRGETFGIACAEAGAFGVPTIAPDIGGVPEVVRHNVNGILVDPGATATEYARQIAELHGNPERYRRLAEGGRMLFETVHNWDAWGQRTSEVLASLGIGYSGQRPSGGTGSQNKAA